MKLFELATVLFANESNFYRFLNLDMSKWKNSGTSIIIWKKTRIFSWHVSSSVWNILELSEFVKYRSSIDWKKAIVCHIVPDHMSYVMFISPQNTLWKMTVHNSFFQPFSFVICLVLFFNFQFDAFESTTSTTIKWKANEIEKRGGYSCCKPHECE